MYDLQCDIETSPGSLERLLRVLRIKGFHLHHLQAKDVEHCVRLEMRVKGSKCVEQLISQLSKQHSVLQIVKLEQQPALQT